MDTNKNETLNKLFNDLKKSLNESKLSVVEAELADKAFVEIEKGNFDEADELLKQALSINPKYSIAYWGRFLVEHKARTINDLIETEDIFKTSINHQRILQYPDQTLIKLIKNIKFERKRLKKLYTQFKDKLEKAKNIDETISLSKTFERIINYKNSIYLLQHKQFLICEQQFSTASTIDEIKSLLECFKTIINDYLLKDLGNMAFERLYEEKLSSVYTIEDIESVTKSFKELLNNKSLRDLETRAYLKTYKTELQSAYTIEDIASVSNSYRELLKNELLKKLETEAYIKTCKAELLSASTIENILSTSVNYKNLLDNKLLNKIEKDSLERLFKDKLRATSSINEIISTSETFKELLNYNLLKTLEKEAFERVCKIKLESASTVEEIVSISNSFKELLDIELLKKLEVGNNLYKTISFNEAKLDYLKNEMAGKNSNNNGTNISGIEKEISQIEQVLKRFYKREDESDIERYTRYIEAISLELDESWKRHYFYWCDADRYGGKFRDYVYDEEMYIEKLEKTSKYYQKRIEALKKQ